MPANNFDIKGLTNEEVLISRTKFGSNTLKFKKESGVLEALKSLAKEPMIILLLVASAIYFASGETGNAVFLLAAIVIVSVISLYQEKKL